MTMRWFKHLTQASEDEKLAEILELHGAEGYGVYWLILEKIAFLMDGTDKTSARYSIKKWAKFCGKSPKILRKFLETFQKLSLFNIEICENNSDFLVIECRKLLKYRDEYSKKSGQTPDNDRTNSGETPDQETETETETDTETDTDSNLEEINNHQNESTDPPVKKSRKASKKPKTDPPSFDEIQSFIENLSDATKSLCKEKGIGQLKFKQLAESCFDHFRGKGEQKADWQATVRNWIRNDEKFNKKSSTDNGSSISDSMNQESELTSQSTKEIL